MCTNEDYKSGNILNINEKLFQLELFDPCFLILAHHHLKILILDYLKNAECIKQKAIDEDVCKGFYDQLLEHIESGKSTDDLCW